MKSDFIDNRRNGGNTAFVTTENKSIVQRALADLVATGDVDSLERLLSDGFVHHRPDSISSTKAEWLADVRTALIPLAEMQVEVHHVLADGDYVVMYSRRWLPGAEPGIAVVDIWRFDDGLIVEAWEIIEPVAQAAANLTWWESGDH
jgi:predicted SnoaL-like aldol condensation-catalyzing enzyme